MRTKSEFYQNWRRNRYGNRLQTWTSLEEALASDYPGPFTLRHASKASSPLMTYNIFKEGLSNSYHTWLEKGVRPSDIAISETAPDQHLTLQGEITVLPGSGLYLFSDQTPGLRMREALKKATHLSGLSASLMLSSKVTPDSWDDLQELLELDAVIEFSTYSKNVGWAKGRNTIIWEVRKY